MSNWKFSRSHDQTYIDCPRKAFYQYYYGGTGIVPKTLNLYQATGQLTHDILKEVMILAKSHDRVPTPDEMSRFCKQAIDAYTTQVREQGFGEAAGEVELEIGRQTALAEGLARAWAKVRLPQIIEHYRVVAAEEEHEIPIGPGQRLLSRLDGVLERKMDGELMAGPEFKTTGWISDDYIESWRYSTQTISHCLDVKEAFGKMPVGVALEFLYKGVKRKSEDGSYVYYSPLVRAYRMTDEFGKDHYGYESNLARKKDWSPFDTYTMGMEKWFGQLPDDIIEGLLFNTVVYRSEAELAEWTLQVEMRQRRIQAGIQILEEHKPTREAADEVMATVFPARLDHYCYQDMYKKKCPYLDICYHTIDDPLGSGAFVPREPHHPGEMEED